MKTWFILTMCLPLLGCKEQTSKHRQYSYLSDKMNGKEAVPRYTYKALEYTNQIKGVNSPIAYKLFERSQIYAGDADVSFNDTHVLLYLRIQVTEPTPFAWVEGQSIEERTKIGSEICEAHIRRLAMLLECDLQSIEAIWVCTAGQVDGKLSGSSLSTK